MSLAFEAAKKERLLQLAAFDKGVQWACDQITNIVAADLQVRESHGWPLHYKTLSSNVLVFICGQMSHLRKS